MELRQLMTYNDSTQLFIDLLSKIDDYTKQVSVSDTDRQKFKDIIYKANRILVTGTGTSLPVAQYFASRLQGNYTKKPIYYMPTAKAIRTIDQNYDYEDLVIIVSHGFNRADALIIRDKAKKKSCKTIVISGNPDAVSQADLAIIVPPLKEKIFCRPISPLTSLLAVESLCSDGPAKIPTKIPDLKMAKNVAKALDPRKQTIVLYSADVSFAAELWTIMLREGAGINASIKDIENYAHGYYGPDTAVLQDRQYIIIISDSVYDRKDFARARGLYTHKGFAHILVTSKGSQFFANAQLFREAPEVIKQLLIRTGHDMYGPVGMDENRYYHEYTHHTDY